MSVIDEVQAIRTKFAGRSRTHRRGLTPSEARVQGVVLPDPAPRSDAERDARDQERAAHDAYRRACTAVADAEGRYRALLDGDGPFSRGTDAGAVARARRDLERAEHARSLAETDHAAARARLRAVQAAERAQRQQEATAVSAARDAAKRASRRADGLPPLAEPERFVVARWR